MPTTTTVPTGGPVPYDPDGHQVVGRTPIGQAAAGGVSAGPGTTVLTNVPAANNAHIVQHIRMQCSAAPAADGTISIQDTNGNVIFVAEVVATFVKGQQIEAFFDTPKKTLSDAVAVQAVAAANTGTWRYYIDGFTMNSNVIV